MSKINKSFVRAIAAAAALALPLLASAESSYVTTATAGTYTATAHVDFSVVIAQSLFLQVGTGTVNGSNATVNLVTFTVGAANNGNGTAVAGTGGDGTGAGQVTAKLQGNGGNITFSSTTTGDLTNGTASQSIPYSQIATAATAVSGFAGTVLAAPILSSAGIGTGATNNANVTAPANGVVNAAAVWTFSFLNTNLYPAGTYGGANVRNGRVLYTASMQ